MLDFKTPPTQAIVYLLSKKPYVLEDKASFKHNIAQKAFVISGITNIDYLSAFQNSLALAMLKGQSFYEWKKANASLIEAWEGVDAKRLKRIYDFNLKNAYAQGRKMEMMSRPSLKEPRDTRKSPIDDEDIFKRDKTKEVKKPEIKEEEGIDDGWYIRFTCVLDSATRPTHRALHGTILPRRHSFWEDHTPPLDWGCRCRIDMLSKYELESRGLSPSQEAPSSSMDNPFSFKEQQDELENIIHKKLEALKANKTATKALKAIQVEMEKREQCFKAVRRLWDSKERKSFELCKIKGGVSDLFGEKSLFISADTIQRHKNKHKEIDAFDYSLIPYMLENIDSLYRDPKDERYLIILSQKFGRFYRLALKHIKDKNEVWVSSLLGIDDKKSFQREKRKLQRSKTLVVVKE